MSKIESMLWRDNEMTSGPDAFVFAVRSQQVQAGIGEGGFEVTAAVILVRDQGLTLAPAQEIGVIAEQVGQDLTFVWFTLWSEGLIRFAGNLLIILPLAPTSSSVARAPSAPVTSPHPASHPQVAVQISPLSPPVCCF